MNKLDICRVCLDHGDMKPFFTTNCSNKHNVSCAIALAKISSIEANKDDGLPIQICKKCLKKLKAAYKFRILCEDSYKKLKALYFESITEHETENLNSDLYTNKKETEFEMDDTDFIAVVRESELITNTQSLRANVLHINNIDGVLKDNLNMSCIRNGGVKFKGKDIKKPKKKSKIYQCSFCGKSFHRKGCLKKHEDDHVDGDESCFCEMCQKNHSSGDKCPVVHRPRGPLPFCCPHPGCLRSFPIKSRLQVHLKVHTDERNFICQYCSHAARDKQQLNVHIRYFHTKERNYLCGTCGKAFVSPQARYYHAKRHENIRNHHCHLCDKSGLQEHLVTHTGEKRFPCSLCESRFNRKAHKEKHETSIHGLKRPPAKRAPTRCNTEPILNTP